MLQKSIYPYEYIDWVKKFNEASLPENKYLTTEDITDDVYKYSKRDWGNCGI